MLRPCGLSIFRLIQLLFQIFQFYVVVVVIMYSYVVALNDFQRKQAMR